LSATCILSTTGTIENNESSRDEIVQGISLRTTL